MSREDELIDRLYPDLHAHGGALNWARELLKDKPQIEVPGIGRNYAFIQSGSRSAQIFVGAEVRLFQFDLWEDGKAVADGEHGSFELVVGLISEWVTTTKSAEEMENLDSTVKSKSRHPKTKVTPGTHLITKEGLKKM